MSSHNPFRDPASSLASSSTTPPALPARKPTINRPEPQAAPAETSANGALDAHDTGLTDELPPAYTARPNQYQGESTVEYGPNRPFQPAPAPPSRPHFQAGYQPQYVPPPGPPHSSTQPPVHNDHRPTPKPVPGHPLMNAGRILVVPSGRMCWKCQNTGYKHNDPSHPCRKCWEKYGKAFSGPLAYSDFTPSAPGRDTLQQPLPNFGPPRPPQHPASMQPIVRNVTGLGSGMGRGSFGGGGFNSGPGFGSFGRGFGGPGFHPAHRVVRPGDPSIGGRLCYRCGGSGTVFLLFLTDTCDACGGIGRIL
ncbi:hypothetical protein CYLTODRAFT_417426 [Cylindrobasidium torrendii FP15055 ss-10]|uniref:Uncharacterized protein n=1 Tax=Cylindrobasidium torrendii FP15055 ss-10 TaxID=1314674 RepID=A0A0D7BTG8_9AGAR|nr:hypothetical protein CYLTODRAFT_417426 [Cylindrobasidium torrendii FP15055 ss-10]